jgi:hypothetical protein
MHDGARATEQTDTTPRAQARYLRRLQETSPEDKLRRALALSARVRGAAMADLERAMPGATRQELAVAFIRRLYGQDLARRVAPFLLAR